MRPIFLFAWVPFLISLAISAAVSTASFIIQRLLRPTINRGKIGGDLQVQDSAWGAFVNEVYGGIDNDAPTTYPTWGTPTNCTIGTQNNPIKTGGSDGTFDAKVVSTGTFGYSNAGDVALPYNLQFTSRADGGWGCGFVPDEDTTGISGAGFAYGILVDTDGKIQCWGDATNRFESAAGAFAPGDALRIEVELQSIRYYHKNQLLVDYTQNAFSGDPGPYKIRAIMKNTGARVDEVEAWQYSGTRSFDGTTAPATMTGAVNATIDPSTGAIQKTGGTNGAWDAGARSIDINAGSIGNGIAAAWKVDRLGDWAVGFALTDPAGDWNAISLVVKGDASGMLKVYKVVSGTQTLIDDTGGYSVGDVINFYHIPGSSITYPTEYGLVTVYINGAQILYGFSGPQYDNNDQFYCAVAIATSNLKITDLKFAPIVSQSLSRPDLTAKESGVRLAGNIIWASDIRKHTNTKKTGGKGGGQKVREFSYDADLAIMIGRGPLRVLKIWANADLLYDATANAAPTGVYDETTAEGGTFTPTWGSLQNRLAQYAAHYQRIYSSFFGEQTRDGNGVVTAYFAKTGTTCRIYPGNETQTVDPLMQADVDGREGAGSTPAYRGRCYVVLEQFYFKSTNIQKDGSDSGYDYGGIPNFRFLVYNETHQTVEEICVDLADRAGLESAAYDFSALSAIECRGLVISQRQPPRETFESLADAYGVDFYEDEAQVIGYARGAATAATIEDYELGWLSEDDPARVPVKLQHKLIDEIQLPRRVDVRFTDPAKDFESGTVGESRQVASGERVATVDLPITMSADEAKEVAYRKLFEAWAERKTSAVELGPKYSYLRPGDVVAVNEEETTFAASSPATLAHRYRVAERSGEAGSVQKFALVPEEQWIYDDAATVTASQVTSVATAAAPSPTLASIIDVVPLRDVDDAPGIYLALGPMVPDALWAGATFYEVEADGDLVEIGGANKAATIGTCVNTLPDAPASSWDLTSFLIVDLGNAATLASITEAEAYEGRSNAALVGDEIIIFRDAELLAGYSRRYRLWNFLRARKGTDNGAWSATGPKGAGHVADERFVLLDDAIQFIELDLSARGVARTYKAITGGQPASSAPSGTFTYGANNLKPLAPVQIAATRDGSNNITLTWVRRARINAGLVDYVDAPLDEPTESYEIDIMSGATVKRTITAASATASYSAANQTTDFGSAQNPVSVRVYQMSARVGRGRAGTASV